MATTQERNQLRAMRLRHHEAATDWTISHSGEELYAVIVPAHPPVAIATLSADCGYDDREFLLHVYNDMKLLLRLFDEACDIIRRQHHAPARRQSQSRYGRPVGKSADYAAECAMKCNDTRFMAFLRDEHRVDISDGERIKSAVRDILAVASRGELNSDPAAAARWQSLKGEFDLWSRT